MLTARRALTRTLCTVVVLGMISMLSVGKAQERALFVDGGPSRMAALGTTVRSATTGLIRYRLVRVDEDQLADAFADASRGNGTPAPVLTLNLFDDVMHRAIITGTDTTSSGYALLGDLVGVPFGITVTCVR